VSDIPTILAVGATHGSPSFIWIARDKGDECVAPTMLTVIHRVPMVGCGDEGTALVPVPVTIIVKAPAAKC